MSMISALLNMQDTTCEVTFSMKSDCTRSSKNKITGALNVNDYNSCIADACAEPLLALNSSCTV